MRLYGRSVAIFGLVLSPVHGADATATGLVGCWRDTYPLAELLAQGAEIRMLPDGSNGLVWNVDPSTEENHLIMIPYQELCFEVGGAMVSTNIGFNEGRDTGGTYLVENGEITVRDNYHPNDAWPFPAESVTCTLKVDGDMLSLTGCTDGVADPVDLRMLRHVGE